MGFNVFAGCLRDDGKDYLKRHCSDRLTPITHDVSRAESNKAALDVVQRALPPNTGLWGLVNNAGIAGNMSPSELCTREDYQRVFEVNMLGTVDTTNTFLPLIRQAKGRVINMGSASGRLAVPPAPDGIAKYGMEAYTDILRRELYSRNVSVVLIEPGMFLTGIVQTEALTEGVRSRYDRATQEVKDTYGDVVGKFQKMCQLMIKLSSPNTHKVIDAYVHGLTSRFPRTRYVVGVDSRFILIPLSYLPTCFTDWLLQYR
ncbi:retinol dehydrogenase 7-like isoform X2 [Physella acuta]|nr:retinol dehydrogenase 7-like isoform X2 [Physella acuta]